MSTSCQRFMKRFNNTCMVLMCFLMFAAPTGGGAQSIPVALMVTEETGGLFESRILSALRGLGDIEVVPWTEVSYFKIYAVVMCVSDEDLCQTANAYVASLRLSAPINPGDILWALHSADTTIGVGEMGLPVDDAADRLVRYERTIKDWVAKWGRREYQQAIDEWVAQIDTQCFETYRQRRFVWDLLARGDHQRANALGLELERQDSWNCLP